MTDHDKHHLAQSIKPGDEHTVEQCLYQVVEDLRGLGYKVQCVTAQAVIDRDLNDDGKWDDNPDNFGGSEPGNFTLRVYQGANEDGSPKGLIIVEYTEEQFMEEGRDFRRSDIITALIVGKFRGAVGG